MNIAFPAFFLLVLILPGFIFLNAYERTENTAIERKPFDVSSALAFFFAGIIHTITIASISLIGLKIDYGLCIKLMTGVKLLQSDLNAIQSSIPHITCYFIFIYSFSFVLGKLTQYLVFKSNPYKSSLFSFDTPWYYELKGKLSEVENAEFIKLSCLVETKEGSYLYYGMLEGFHLNSTGALDRIVLSDVSRRKLENDDSEQGKPPLSNRFYHVKGKRFVLRYDQIQNINIEYLYIQEEE